jgi:riboflavin kinase/FMN adenylyltransferase
METGGESVLISFDPHPAIVFNPGNCNAVKFLSTTEEKISLLAEAGVDHLVIIKFSREFASLSAEDYIRDFVCGKVNAKKVLSGYNHHFGKAAQGDNSLLKSLSEKYNFDVVEIAPELVENELVSNSVILKSLAEGNVMRVNSFLGYSYYLSGKLKFRVSEDKDFYAFEVEGINCHKILPAFGRYAARVICADGRFRCLAEITTDDKGDKVRFYLNKDDLCSFGSDVKLYFYKNLSLLDIKDEGYFF